MIIIQKMKDENVYKLTKALNKTLLNRERRNLMLRLKFLNEIASLKTIVPLKNNKQIKSMYQLFFTQKE